MTARTKICGLSTPEAVRAALDGGAAYLGFMFFEKSPRNIAPDAAARLAVFGDRQILRRPDAR